MDTFWIDQLVLLIRILLAGICGAVIGYERKNRMKEAGIRTHMIVALGASLIMIVSKYGFDDVLGNAGIALDPSRIAAQIVTGVGFLGAGMIFMRKNMIMGLTTAAGVWVTSGIGMAIGCGLYAIGVISTIFVVVIQIILHGRWIHEAMKDEISFVIEKDKTYVHELEKQLQTYHIEIDAIKISEKNNSYVVVLTVSLPESYHVADLLKLFKECSYIKEIEV